MSTIENSKLLDLSGKTAVVTGGALGIGFGIASRLAEAGANVVIANRTPEEGEKAASELKSKGWIAESIPTDVSVEEEVKNLVKKTVSAFGSLDIFVNNAGIFPNIQLKDMSLADFDKLLSINLKGVFLTTKYCSEQMIAQGKGGKIINITSIDAIHPSMIGLAHYDASKHGVWGFTKNVAIELAEHNIWVNAIAPGGIATEGVRKLSEGGPSISADEQQKVIESFMSKIPMHRMGLPDEIGKVALFLASDMSSYMTGSQIVVDGGALLS
jgi:2-dehydro-3-deoxy-D-gluconate 5-dehydrogenase